MHPQLCCKWQVPLCSWLLSPQHFMMPARHDKKIRLFQPAWLIRCQTQNLAVP